MTTGPGLAALLLDRYGVGVLPASAFGEDESVLRVRVATGLLYGDTTGQREEALAAADPVSLPWIAAPLRRLGEVLVDLARDAGLISPRPARSRAGGRRDLRAAAVRAASGRCRRPTRRRVPGGPPTAPHGPAPSAGPSAGRPARPARR